MCRSTNNFFVKSEEKGDFIIKDGIIKLKDKYLKGQYIAITGSILSSGIYKLSDYLYSLDGATDEEWTGIVYGLAIPPDFIALKDEIANYINQNPQTNIVSYSFGISSVNYATNKNGKITTWRDIFAIELNNYYRMFKQIDL